MRDDEEVTIIDFVCTIGFLLMFPLLYVLAFMQHGWPWE